MRMKMNKYVSNTKMRQSQLENETITGDFPIEIIKWTLKQKAKINNNNNLLFNE